MCKRSLPRSSGCVFVFRTCSNMIFFLPVSYSRGGFIPTELYCNSSWNVKMTMRQSGSASSLLVWSGLNFSRLANMLNVIAQGKKHPSTDTVEQALTTATLKYCKHLDAIQMESRWITRLESCQGRLMTALGPIWRRIALISSALGVVCISYYGKVLQFLHLTDRAGKN